VFRSVPEHRYEPSRAGGPGRRDRPARTYRVPWADLLTKVFAVDVLASPCGGRLQFIAFIAEAAVAKRILDHLGLDSPSALRSSGADFGRS